MPNDEGYRFPEEGSDEWHKLADEIWHAAFRGAWSVRHDDVLATRAADLVTARILKKGAEQPNYFRSRKAVLAIAFREGRREMKRMVDRRPELRSNPGEGVVENAPAQPPIDQDLLDHLHARLDAAMKDFTDEGLLLLFQRYVLCRKFEEIASSLGCSTSTAHRRCGRALEKLCQIFDQIRRETPEILELPAWTIGYAVGEAIRKELARRGLEPPANSDEGEAN